MGHALKSREMCWDGLVKEVCEVMQKVTGNVLTFKQYPMVESRLRKRCSDLKITSADEYYYYWKTNETYENRELTGILTTHFTAFFREFSHFEWIARELPRLVQAARKENRKTLNFWSAACSKGQEVWSLCMWLNNELQKIDPSINFKVMGSDIDKVSLNEAKNGVYHRRELETAPRHLWEKHWVKGKDEISDWYKINKELKDRASFQCLNLLELSLPKSEKFDVILCRNVLIYFDRKNQDKACRSLLEHLSPHGVLITGMSESLSGAGLPIRSVSPSIYLHSNAEDLNLPVKVRPTLPEIPKTLKVMCIDDSPTIIIALKKLLRAPDFEIIAVAQNGQDAIEQLKTIKPDVITLDLHMPIMDGPTFLKQSGIAQNLPVIIVSSVDRDHAPLMEQLSAIGICDYVEKPSLSNMNQVGEELAQKLRMSWLAKKNKIVSATVTTFKKDKKREKAAVVFNFGPQDLAHLQHVLLQQSWSGDEINFVFSGTRQEYEAIKRPIELTAAKASQIKVVTSNEHFKFSTLPTIWVHFNNGLVKHLNSKRERDFLVAEEAHKMGTSLTNCANDFSPYTSFSYLIDKLLKAE